MKTALKIIAILITLMLLTQCVEEPTTSPITAVGGVVKDANGLPVVGATVTLSSKSTTTDGKGAYYFDGVNAGSYLIKAEKSNYVAANKNITISFGVVASEDISVLRFGGITGKITDAAEIGIAGVKITTTPATKEVYTDASGNYSLSDLTAGSYIIIATKTGYVNKTKQVTVSDGQTTNGDISVLTLGSIVGKVTGATGTGIQSVKITTTPATKEVYTDASGSYSLSDLTAGSYAIKAEKTGFVNKTKQVTVADGLTANGDILVLTLGSIVGKISGATGTGIQSVKITTTPATKEVYTDASGNYSLTDLIAGNYVITASKTGFAKKTKQVTVADGLTANGDILVLTLGSIVGKISGATGTGIQSVKITTTPATKEVYTDASGSYSLSDLTAGSYTIKAEKIGYVNKTKQVTVTDGQTTNGDISVLTLGKIVGKITGATEIGIAGVKITTTPATKEVYTDASGSYSLSDLTAGSYIIIATKTGYVNKTKQVTVSDGQITYGDLVIFKEGEAPENMVYVQGGTFQMGSTSGDSDEQPIHSVTLSNFYIGKYEVTFAEYDAFCDATGRIKPSDSGWGRGNRPVINVSWDDATEYCTWAGGRLPTEAEWEYAARGGSQSQGYTYSGSNTIDNVAWYSSNSGGKTQEVGTKQPNELGIYDMSGNVWEWCNDWYDESYYSNSPSSNPKGPSSGTLRVLRGGSWFNYINDCRSSPRYRLNPYITYLNNGFRLVQG